ncbi:hypothetical protein HQ585_02070 [candidate division KSB1 bacterium]|nr:hypothetical protein [candidate division KSB1 bacterium]
MRTKEKVFNQEETYRKCDIIFHPVFKDHGTIIQIDLIQDKQQKLVVDFEKVGQKKLLAGYKA